MSTLEKIFAEKLLNVKAIKLQPEQPFTWASGWKSPFYCDNRKTLAFPTLRSFVKLELSRIVAEKYPEADAIAGVATGAIAQGALVADALGLPFAYVRSKAKDHGMANLIEGDLKEGMKVVVIEDLISTGGSSLKLYNLHGNLLKHATFADTPNAILPLQGIEQGVYLLQIEDRELSYTHKLFKNNASK